MYHSVNGLKGPLPEIFRMDGYTLVEFSSHNTKNGGVRIRLDIEETDNRPCPQTIHTFLSRQ